MSSNLALAAYPELRLRRNRKADWKRRLVAENALSVNDLILPLFIREDSEPAEIQRMPGVKRYALSELEPLFDRIAKAGIPLVALFPSIDVSKKDEEALEAFNENNVLSQAIRFIKKSYPDVGVMADVALDPYTSHGQDGIIRDGEILNDETIEALIKQAMVLVQAGVDIIAPSDMMDGRVGALRKALDAQNFHRVSIMAYAAKYASHFYGPFREAVGSLNLLGKANKRTYQLNPANRHEALREVALDLKEGADMVIVKPGLPYLDIVREVKSAFACPTFAYQVSGEYSMIKIAAAQGAVDFEGILSETLLCFKRAGADGILTYAAMEMAKILEERGSIWEI